MRGVAAFVAALCVVACDPSATDAVLLPYERAPRNRQPPSQSTHDASGGLDASDPPLQRLEHAKFGTRPNFVIVYLDDSGFSDLGLACAQFGTGDNGGRPCAATPRMDALARGGVWFSDFHVAASVCTPSRAGLLTGRLAARSSMHLVLMQADTRGLPPAELTLAEMLGRSGYDTAFTGKWHLGWNPAHRPVRQGFDEALAVPFSVDMGCHVAWECAHADYFGAHVRPASGALPKGLADALRTACRLQRPLDDLGGVDGPLVPKHQPHCPRDRGDRSGRERWEPVAKRYGYAARVAPLALVHGVAAKGGAGGTATHTVVQQPLNVSALAEVHASFAERFVAAHRARRKKDGLHDARPFFLYIAPHHVHGPLTPARAWQGRSGALGPYGDAMLEVDAMVGRVADALEAAGVDENTLLFASSDNGPYPNRARQLLGGQFGPFNKGGKGTAYEGGQRVWAFARWPGHIRKHGVSRALASAMDLMPTFATLAGVRLPRDRYYDGRDLSAVLFDRSHHHHTSMLCFGAKVSEGAVRVGRWKVMLVGKAERVYDVDADPRERKDLSAHKGAPRNLTHGERYLLLRAGWKPSMPFVPPLKKAAKVLWKEWKDSRELEGHWITDAKPPGMHALSRDGRGGCKASPIEECFACCDPGAYDCHCKDGYQASAATAACSKAQRECAIDALSWLPARPQGRAG